MKEILERIRGALVGLRMPRALEALNHTMKRLDIDYIEACPARYRFVVMFLRSKSAKG